MVEFKYITKNERGTPILADTKTNIVPIGVAHENGVTEAELLAQYGMERAKLHSALAYFYEHREEIRDYQAETKRLLQEYGRPITETLEELRQRRK